MNVYSFTTKISKGTTVGMPVHVAFYVKIYDQVPNDFDETKKLILMNIKNVLLGLGVSKHQQVCDRWKALEICFKT